LIELSMNENSAALLRTLMKDSLTVWKVRGDVTSGNPPADVVINAEGGIVVSVEPAPVEDSPIRWWVRWDTPGNASRSRPCTSVVGLLRTVRDAVDAERGYRLRIAPGPAEA
jgi:hypothetical protein